MKIVSIVGARPQFIKAAVVSRSLRAKPGISEVLIHTGQHYDDNMSEVFFRELDIPRPDYNLFVGSASHGVQTGRMLEGIERVLLVEAPDWVVVYGDTNSTVAGAMAACKLQIPTAHVEAGMRSFCCQPEEINRVWTDHASTQLFAPTEAAVANLGREGIGAPKVHLVGDVMYDAWLYYAERAALRSHMLDRLGVVAKAYLLVTLHRAENTDCRAHLRALTDALREIAAEFPVIFPLHPRTRKSLANAGLLDRLSSSAQLIEPVGYLDLMALESNARLIATDSGGVQREAFFARVPCVTLRDETEWVELAQAGWIQLVSPARGGAAIASALREMLSSVPLPLDLPFSDGHTADRIRDAIWSATPADRLPTGTCDSAASALAGVSGQAFPDKH